MAKQVKSSPILPRPQTQDIAQTPHRRRHLPPAVLHLAARIDLARIRPLIYNGICNRQNCISSRQEDDSVNPFFILFSLITVISLVISGGLLLMRRKEWRPLAQPGAYSPVAL